MLDDMLNKFKDHAELALFAEAQHKTINNLSTKIVTLEEENKHLKLLLETTTDVVKKPQLIDLSPYLTNEEIISETQLKLLKEKSFERELTLEECKKVSEYSKILNTLKNKPKVFKSESKNLTDQELLEMFNESK